MIRDSCATLGGEFVDAVRTFVLSVPLHALLMSGRSFKDAFELKQTAGCSTLQLLLTTVARTKWTNFPSPQPPTMHVKTDKCAESDWNHV